MMGDPAASARCHGGTTSTPAGELRVTTLCNLVLPIAHRTALPSALRMLAQISVQLVAEIRRTLWRIYIIIKLTDDYNYFSVNNKILKNILEI